MENCEITQKRILPSRLRRLRQQPALRNLVREATLSVHDLVLPLFIKEGLTAPHPIASMPGCYQLSLHDLPQEIEHIQKLNIPAVILFGIPAHKDAQGSASFDQHGVIQQAIRSIKSLAPELLVMADCCFCEYTDHGHCGVVTLRGEKNWDVDNDLTLDLLARQAIAQAQAGADIIAPSGMMDGMVGAIRSTLDASGFSHVPILSYAVKYASALYGPFREATEGAPQFGDRSTYQMDPGNGLRALREAELDVAEGADMLMVKPGSYYLDIIYRIKQAFPGVPLGAYQVSGEFAMIKSAAERGWVDEMRAAQEALLSMKRAGADFIITYFAKALAEKMMTTRTFD